MELGEPYMLEIARKLARRAWRLRREEMEEACSVEGDAIDILAEALDVIAGVVPREMQQEAFMLISELIDPVAMSQPEAEKVAEKYARIICTEARI